MSQSVILNRRIVLAARPTGAPEPQHFRLEQVPLVAPGEEGQVLLRTVYLSIDPYMRGRMSAGPSYAPPLEIGETFVGGAVSRVVESRNPNFAEGDLVLSNAGWQEYALSDGHGLTPIGPLPRPSYALGVLGMPGFTAWHGLLKIGAPKPGDTVVVAAASGAVGSIVGQIAKRKGARAVGIAGGALKSRYVVEELGFDACIDHHDPQFATKLASAAPDGIDVYFENVGGKVLEAVLPLLNTRARIPVCGLISQYNASARPAEPDRAPQLLWTLLYKRVRAEGFIILDHYAEEFAAFTREMSEWLASSQVKVREDIVEGLENAPAALIGLLEGKNFGKVVVRVGD